MVASCESLTHLQFLHLWKHECDFALRVIIKPSKMSRNYKNVREGHHCARIRPSSLGLFQSYTMSHQLGHVLSFWNFGVIMDLCFPNSSSDPGRLNGNNLFSKFPLIHECRWLQTQGIFTHWEEIAIPETALGSKETSDPGASLWPSDMQVTWSSPQWASHP